VGKFEDEFLKFVKTKKSDLRGSIEKSIKIDEAAETQLKTALDEFEKTFSLKNINE